MGASLMEMTKPAKTNIMDHEDQQEKELAAALESEEWVSDLDETQRKKYEAYAGDSLNKQKRINIRMTQRDLMKIRARAIQEGIPYQSLISMLIHKYNEGKINYV